MVTKGKGGRERRAEPRPAGGVGPHRPGSKGSATRKQSRNCLRPSQFCPGPRATEPRSQNGGQGSREPRGPACSGAERRCPEGGCADLHHGNRVCGSASDPKPPGRVAGVPERVRPPASPSLAGTEAEAEASPLGKKFPQVRPGVFLQIQIKHGFTRHPTHEGRAT